MYIYWFSSDSGYIAAESYLKAVSSHFAESQIAESQFAKSQITKFQLAESHFSEYQIA